MNDMEINKCSNCTFYECEINDFPCDSCIHGGGTTEHFINKGEPTPEQPTIPKMPPVISPKNSDEINHPQRYAGGKYECIDVMTDVFGVDAVRNFCKLNAFKYIWREKQKNGVEDLKKASWYLSKLIELSEGEKQ